MSIKLYDQDSFLSEFQASVVSCTKTEKGYEIVLDQTAFFPESGGQYGDRGTIAGNEVVDTYHKNGEIVHLCLSADNLTDSVTCKLDFDDRFKKMQNHTAEHIVSSIINRKYGFVNVGFHLSKDFVTCDFNGLLTKEQLSEIELLANQVVFSNVPVRAYYPDEETLNNLVYRSKGELEGKVRIVEIEGVDYCACCAPHVKQTGQIGIIKIVDSIKYKSGIRITMKSGAYALDDYRMRFAQDELLSNMLSAPQNDLIPALQEKLSSLDQKELEISRLKNAMIDIVADKTINTEKNICVNMPLFKMDDLRKLCNSLIEKTNELCVAISETEDGYLFVCESKTINLRELSKKLSIDLDGKCGGSETMISGKLKASKEKIAEYFEKGMFHD